MCVLRVLLVASAVLIVPVLAVSGPSVLLVFPALTVVRQAAPQCSVLGVRTEYTGRIYIVTQ